MNTNITPESILAVSNAILGKGPRVDSATYKAHVPAYVTKSGEVRKMDQETFELNKSLIEGAFQKAKEIYEAKMAQLNILNSATLSHDELEEKNQNWEATYEFDNECAHPNNLEILAAIESEDASTLRLLIEKGHSVTFTAGGQGTDSDRIDHYPLYVASKIGNLEIIQTLINAGCNIKAKAFFYEEMIGDRSYFFENLEESNPAGIPMFKN